jgi:hypothetical protein
MVGYTCRNIIFSAPRYDSFDDLSAHLEEKCLARQGDTLRGHTQTIGSRLVSDLAALMGRLVAEYEACDHVSTLARSISMVRYRSNDCSVPVAYSHHDVHACGFAPLSKSGAELVFEIYPNAMKAGPACNHSTNGPSFSALSA